MKHAPGANVATFLHVVRVQCEKWQAVAGVTYPAGAMTCVARAHAELQTKPEFKNGGRTVWATTVEAQKNYTGRAPNFKMYEVPS